MPRLPMFFRLLLLIVPLLGWAGLANAGETATATPPTPEWRYPSSALELGVGVGGGISFAHGIHGATLGAILPRLGVVLTEQERLLRRQSLTRRGAWVLCGRRRPNGCGR